MVAITGVPAHGDQPTFTLTDISGDKDAGTYTITAANGQNVGNYTVNLVAGSLTITPKALGQATANTAAAPINAKSPADNLQVANSVVVQGATKVYDGDNSTDPTTYTVLKPSDDADLVLPTFTAADFTTVTDSQNVGNHVVTLSSQGLAKLQQANKNYMLDAKSIQNGLLVITPAPVTITAPNLIKTYDAIRIWVTLMWLRLLDGQRVVRRMRCTIH
ncbi:MBG domain-containing protein [Secundilactobacillus silagei]|uniref:MBG domain-containing protein n=1 Tax=Secundilactobacillus silagei TaxID=1293415 RepID=UPI0006D09797|nr:MBG domain-containing protein [Secundilactobacillus silagei]